MQNNQNVNQSYLGINSKRLQLPPRARNIREERKRPNSSNDSTAGSNSSTNQNRNNLSIEGHPLTVRKVGHLSVKRNHKGNGLNYNQNIVTPSMRKAYQPIIKKQRSNNLFGVKRNMSLGKRY